MKSVKAIDFYIYSLKIGLKYIKNSRGKLIKEAIRRIFVPLDLFRYFELPETLRQLSPKKGEKILDLSSPKLISLYIAEHFRADVTAVDIYKEEIESWEKLTHIIDPLRKRYQHLKLAVADGTKLPFRDNYFDKVFSISVLEHIPENGDSRAIKELARVLKPGGTIVITTTFSKKYREEFVSRSIYGNIYDGNKPVFFQRIYDENSLRKRLINPSKLKLVGREVCGGKYPFILKLYGKLLPFSSIIGLLFPIVAKVSLVRNSNKILKSNVILLVMRKI